MFIDDLNLRECYDLGYAIDKHPVKIAGILFPHRPPMYVQITKLIKKYLYYRAADLRLGYLGNLPFGKIAADIYCDIPAWGKTINLRGIKGA